MLGLKKNSPYRKALIELIGSINFEIGLSKENQGLIVLKLDTEEKIIMFNYWIKLKIQNQKLCSTESEIMMEVVKISKIKNHLNFKWFHLLLAGVEGIEPSSGVLETLILPMNYTPKHINNYTYSTFFVNVFC